VAAVPLDWSPYPNISAYFERMRKVKHWVRMASSGPRETVLAQANA
jgi:glutathione S-transferase